MKYAIARADGVIVSIILSDLATAQLNAQYRNCPYCIPMTEEQASSGVYVVKNGDLVKMPDGNPRTHDVDPINLAWVGNADRCAAITRTKRQCLLLESDWTQLPDVPLPTKEAWATYRQALRDVTLQTDPWNIVWPVMPV